MNKRRSERNPVRYDMLFIGPAFILYTIFFFIPILISLVYSFTDWDGIQKVAHFVGLENYIHSFTMDRDFKNALRFTILFTIGGIIGVNTIGLLFALLLNMRWRVRNVVRTMVYLPNVVSVLVVGFLWKFMYRAVLPDIGKLLHIPFLQQNFLINFKSIVWVIEVPAVWQSIGFAMIIYIAGLQGIPESLRESMILDGAGPFQLLRHLTIPFLTPAITTCMFTVTTGALKVYDIIMAMTDGGPGKASVSLALHIHREGLNAQKYGGGSAKAMIFGMITLAITVIQFIILRSREVDM